LPAQSIGALHQGDIYNLVNLTYPFRLETAGLTGVVIKTNPFGWAVQARKLRLAPAVRHDPGSGKDAEPRT